MIDSMNEEHLYSVMAYAGKVGKELMAIKLLTRPKKVETNIPINEAHNPKGSCHIDPMIAHLCQLSHSFGQLRRT